MIYEYPEYYTMFRCIGGGCEDSCCIGWELDIDDESYDYYKNVTGEFGDRLRYSMEEREDNSFVLKEDGRCPFLNSENLCDIYINLGEESLCSVCTEYPRNHEIIGDYKQSDIGLSCLEAARLHFNLPEPVRYIMRKDKLSGEETLTRTDRCRLKSVLCMRDALIGVIQHSEEPDIQWRDKAVYMLRLAEEWQNYWNAESYRKIRSSCRHLNYDMADASCVESAAEHKCQDGIMRILDTVDGLELLRDDLKTMIDRYRMLYDESKWNRFIKEANAQYNDWMEQLLTYYTFRYMIRAYYDNNIMTKVVMTVFSCIVIECMDYVRWIDNGYRYTIDDRIDVAHLYAKEVEHSDDNLEYLEEEFIFGDEFKPDELTEILNRDCKAVTFKI